MINGGATETPLEEQKTQAEDAARSDATEGTDLSLTKEKLRKPKTFRGKDSDDNDSRFLI